MATTKKPWHMDWTVPDSIKQGSASYRLTGHSTPTEEESGECSDADCGQDEDHDHGPACTTGCRCGRGSAGS